MNRILLIEDDGELAETICNMLCIEHSIEQAYSYLSAIDALEAYNGDFDCIILDLDIPSHGLKDVELKRNYHGILGILVLTAFCERKTLEVQKEIWGKTIVYSAFIGELNGKEIMKNPPCLPKLLSKQTTNSISKLVKAVKEVVTQKR